MNAVLTMMMEPVHRAMLATDCKMAFVRYRICYAKEQMSQEIVYRVTMVIYCTEVDVLHYHSWQTQRYIMQSVARRSWNSFDEKVVYDA